MKTDDEMYQSLLSRWEDYKDNKRKNTTRIIFVPAAVLGVCFAFWVAGNVNRILKTGDSDNFIGSAISSVSDVITEEDTPDTNVYKFNVTKGTEYDRYFSFKAVKSTGSVSFNGCSTGAARICIHSDSYTGPVECNIIIPDTNISKQSISFSMITGDYYYITIEPWDDYIQAIGEFELLFSA
jgi:hypothetical protein